MIHLHVNSQQAEHPIWLILMTICEKSGATVKILPLTYMYERSFQAKFQGHSDGGEHLPHDLRLKPEQPLFTSKNVTNSTYDQKNAVLTPLKAFFDHSQENKCCLELKITPENCPIISRLAFCSCQERSNGNFFFNKLNIKMRQHLQDCTSLSVYPCLYL